MLKHLLNQSLPKLKLHVYENVVYKDHQFNKLDLSLAKKVKKDYQLLKT